MRDTRLHWDETHLASQNPSDWDLRPEMFNHLDSLYLRCTQTSLPDAAQRKLVKVWCELIPTLNVDRPAFRRHPVAIIHGNDRGVYGQQQAVHG